MIHVMWEFLVKASALDAFQRAYGPKALGQSETVDLRAARYGGATFACIRERRFVDLTGVSWNRLPAWLRQLDRFRA